MTSRALFALLVCLSTVSLAAQSQKAPAAPKSPAAKKAPVVKLEFPERPTEEHPGHLTTEFDRSTNRTMVALRDIPLVNGLMLVARFGIKGNRPTGPSDTGYVSVSIERQSETVEYANNCNIKLTVDGAPFAIGVSSYSSGGGGSGHMYVQEFITTMVPVARMLQLAKAEKIDGKLCNTEFTLGEPELIALRDLLSRMSD